MARPDSHGQPTFFWQGALIVLPVVVLVAVGLFSLRQDKTLAQHEAVERAQTIADILAPQIWTALVKSNSAADSYNFEIDATGRLLSPPAYSAVPVPDSFDHAKLNDEQAGLWLKARRAEFTEDRRPEAIAAYQTLLGLELPREFRAAARYALGVLLEEGKQPEAAARNFAALLDEDPDARGESGLPLRPIAELRLLDLAALGPDKIGHSVTLETVCSNAVQQPSAVSPQILRTAAERATTREEKETVRMWQARWDENELSRALFLAARKHIAQLRKLDGVQPGTNSFPEDQRALWFTSPVPWKRSIANNPEPKNQRPPPPSVEIEGNDWLAIHLDGTGSNHWFRCLGESEVGALASGVVDTAKHLPDYFGIGIEVAGRKLTWSVPDLRVWQEVNYFGRRGGGEKKELADKMASTVLASASPPEAGGEGLKVKVYLTSQAALFKRQYARTFWFGALVAAAAVAALCGFVAAYRAFHRQLRLSEMKSNFVSSVSHELRAPIASVRLMAESLERGKVAEPSRQREYFRFIVQECRRLSALIENVLDFSRIEQGRKEYEFEPTDIVALTRQTVKLMEPYAAERNVTLTFATPERFNPTGSDEISVDGKAIQQALINLIDNAIKHSPKDQDVTVGAVMQSDSTNGDPAPGISSSVSAPSPRGGDVSSPVPTAQELKGSCGNTVQTSLLPLADNPLSAPLRSASPHVELWVQDHGEGIPPADHEKIFERFYRRGSELRRESSGVGIGLSIVKHIVEAHGGRVLVCSDVGQGSRFTIRLPLGKSEETE